MGWKLTGNTSNIDAEVDTTFKSLRVTIRPQEVTGWFSVGTKTGSVTTLAANGAIFSLRQIAATLLIIRRVGIGFITTTGFTTGQVLDYSLIVARAFTVSDSVGTAISITGNNVKHRTSLVTPTSIDMRVSAAAVLTAGTKTLDTNTLSVIGGFAPTTTTGVVIAPSANNLWSHDTGDYPLVLAQNEGINIQNLTLMGAAGVGTAYINIEFAEASSY